jgi:putative ABC transport system ATP-binding protein
VAEDIAGDTTDEAASTADDAPPLVELDGVCLDIGDRHILDHVTAAIPDHGVTVVMGPSGSGKSMLLRLINRLEVPSHGIVRFRGEDVGSLDPLGLRRRIGMVFQRPTPFAGTVRDNLRTAAPTLLDIEMVELLDRCGLPADFLDRDTEGLSGGEAQRVCLARALAAAPEVLLMDEPTASLDPDHTEVIEDLALTLAATGLPLVWVTHALDQADRLLGSHAEAEGAAPHGHALVIVDGRVASPEEADAFRRTGRTADGNGRDGAAPEETRAEEAP